MLSEVMLAFEFPHHLFSNNKYYQNKFSFIVASSVLFDKKVIYAIIELEFIFYNGFGYE
jgi:hypothetical protein